MAIAALILGIAGLLSSGLPFAGIVLGIVAMILGIAGRKKLLAEGRKTGAAIAGVVMGAIALAGNTALTVACLACGAAVAAADPPPPSSSSLLDTPTSAPASSPSGRVMRCDLSSTLSRQCTEYTLTGITTETSAREACNLVQIGTPDAQRIAIADGPCPTANAIARCQPRYGSSSHVYYRDPDPMIDNDAAMAAMEGLCMGTFTRL